MIILNLIRENDFMTVVVLFENKLIKTKNIEKRSMIECLVSALKCSSEAPHYFW